MSAMLVRRTIRHNTWTIEAYRPISLRTNSDRNGPTRSATISPPADGRTAISLETPFHSPRTLFRPTYQQEQSMLNFLLSAATVLLAGSTMVGPAHSAELPKGAAHNIVLVHGAFVDQTSWQPLPIFSRRQATTSRSSKIRSLRSPQTLMPPNRRSRSRTAGPFWSATHGVGSSSRKQGTIPRFRRWFMSPRSRPTSESLWRRCPKPARRPKAATLFIPTTRATSTSTRRCFLPRSRLIFPRRSPRTWLPRNFR